MSHTVEIIKAIKFYSGKQQIDYKALAKASGLNISTIRKLFHSKQPVNIESLCMICEAMGVEILFRPAKKRKRKNQWW